MSDSGSESAASAGAGLHSQRGAQPAGAAAAEVAQVELAEVHVLGTYLSRMADVLLEDTTGAVHAVHPTDCVPSAPAIAALDHCLRQAVAIDTIRRFIAEPQSPVLFLERLPIVRGAPMFRNVCTCQTVKEYFSFLNT